MTADNLITIKGGAYNDIKKALRKWVELYSKDLQDGLIFQLFKNGRGSHIIQADGRLDNERFYYLINYLKYPEEIEYKIDIEGYTTGKENNILRDKKLLVYISSTDKAYDNVFVTTEDDENFKIDFGGKVTGVVEKKIYRFPTDLNMNYPETIRVSTRKISDNERNIDRRFNIITLIAASLLLLSLVVKQFDSQAHVKISFFLGGGIGIWFLGDYKMLQSDKLYLYSLGIAIGYLLCIVAITGEFNKGILDFGALYPLTVVLTQKPARLIYKATLKREPVVDHLPPSFWDVVYMTVLYLGLVVLPFIVMDHLIK